jgi:DNA-binding NtrC family response regulator
LAECILIIDDERNLRATLREILSAAGYATLEAENARDGIETLRDGSPDLVLCDWKMPVAGGEHMLTELGKLDLTRDLPVIVMTAHGTGNNAMRSIQLGAYDFLTKPIDYDELLATVQRALEQRKRQKEIKLTRSAGPGPSLPRDAADRLIGSSRAMLDLFKSIARVADTDVTVLITGESGSGKERVARTIHRQSTRADKPFVVVNCAALPADLLESELFGHEKGAFTGAIARKIGKFEYAAGGTIFLDEIGELPLALQPKLLRVLQEHAFERVGSAETIHADFRVVAATNRNLEEEVTAKQFRADLFYRLQVFAIVVPPLCERRTDIVPLAEHFLHQFAVRNGVPPSAFTEDATLVLQQYSYPGNVRELEHIIERAAILAGGRVITRDILVMSIPGFADRASSRVAPDNLMQLPFHQSVAAWEKKLIENALAQTSGNKSDAARRLGIQRRLLYDKMRSLGIDTAD